MIRCRFYLLLICFVSGGLLSGCLTGLALAVTVGNTGEAISQHIVLASAADDICQQLISQQDLILREIRNLNRELVLLRQAQTKPGIEEIFAGLGYIMGLFGVAFFVLSWQKGRDNASV